MADHQYKTKSIDEFIRFYLPLLVQKKCVLFLGPHFRRTPDGKTVAETMREALQNTPVESPDAGGSAQNAGSFSAEQKFFLNALFAQMQMSDEQKAFLQQIQLTDEQKAFLQQEPAASAKTSEADNWLDQLDDDFDNLFVLKNPGTFIEFELKSLLSDLYQAIYAQPGDYFETVARLPFGAVISCTPDLMLKDTFERLGLPYDFHYYAQQGQKPKPVEENTTILYNLFGRADDPETLIVTYEDFYKFFVSLLGDSQQMPTPLKHILSRAECFMLLGFNLEKWYLPFIVRKVNQEKNTRQVDRFAVLTRDSHFYPETRHKLSTTFMVLPEDTGKVLERLAKAVSDHEARQRGTRPPVPPPDLAWLKKLIGQVESLPVEKSLAALLAEEKRLRPIVSNEKMDNLIVQQGKVREAEDNFSLHIVDFETQSGTKAVAHKYVLNQVLPVLHQYLSDPRSTSASLTH